eukprot:12369170-Heterocapsa_arctica.AAC.1
MAGPGGLESALGAPKYALSGSPGGSNCCFGVAAGARGARAVQPCGKGGELPGDRVGRAEEVTGRRSDSGARRFGLALRRSRRVHEHFLGAPGC